MEEKIEWNRIPASGFFLGYFQDGVELKYYSSKEMLKCLIDTWRDRTLLEVHLFNEETEWRMVMSRRLGEIKAVLSRAEETAQSKEQFRTFEEEVRVVTRFRHVLKKIRLIHYLEFDENDMLAIKGYRIAPGREENC